MENHTVHVRGLCRAFPFLIGYDCSTVKAVHSAQDGVQLYFFL